MLDTDIDQAPFSSRVMVDDLKMHAPDYAGISFRLSERMARAKSMSTWVKWVSNDDMIGRDYDTESNGRFCFC